MLDQILTLPKVAQLLKVAEKTVYTMAQKSQLPAFKVRGQWCFKRVDIDRWIEQQKPLVMKGGTDVAASLWSQIQDVLPKTHDTYYITN